MRLGNALTLMYIYAEGEAELQEASSEAELHGHSLGGTGSPGVVGWHVFWLFEDTSQLFSVGDRCYFRSAYTTTQYSAGKDPTTEDDDDDPLGFRRQHG